MSDFSYKNITIVFFHPYFRDGGVERTNIGLAKELVRLGYKVTFVTILPENYYLEEVRVNGIGMVVLSSLSAASSQINFFMWLRREKKKGAVIVISCQYYVNILCLLFRPFWGRDVLHILSERNHLDEFKINQHGWKQKIVRFLVPIIYRYADVIIGNSKELASDLETVVKRQVEVVYNPTVNKRLFELSEEKITEDWFLSLDGPVFIAAGRLSAQKGFDTLIKAFSVYSKSKSANLVILGEGEDRLALGELALKLGVEHFVTFAGFVDNPYKFIRRAHVFILSSRYEGLPNVLIEALALKTPVISTNCKSGPKEILGNGEWGMLIEVDDVDALSEALFLIVNNYDDAVNATFRAEKILPSFMPENVCRDLISIFKDNL